MVKTDFHTHCLPCLDDGATSPEVSVQMLEMLKKQGIEHVILSSHFYPQTESLDKFILRRTESCVKLNNIIKSKDIPLLSVGAEVNMVRRISEQDLSRLCIENSNLIMLEMPYGPFESWVINELEIIIYEQKLCPIIAHLDRYLAWFKMSDFEDVLSLNDMIYQINVSAFESGKARKFILNLAQSGYPLVLGTDAHDLSVRPPDFSPYFKLLKKKNVKPLLAEAFTRSNSVLPFEC